eukprot:TRINITY_DN4949_c0_g2_i8.p1 TRINITY_DN4949_c0_g2~~TRINITY_DN4949_c0_g2_i8.p1  ORF type:complete len:164 (+),score=30.13 TRINITY_DN4949_c0_g2_i8:510-1001(+)
MVPLNCIPIKNWVDRWKQWYQRRVRGVKPMENSLSITFSVKNDSPFTLIQELIDQADESHFRRDLAAALALYEAINDYAESYHVLYQLGVYTMEGYQVKINQAKALGYFARAKEIAESLPEEDHALFILGEMYANGYGVAKDQQTAIHFYKKASKLGHELASL